MRKFEISLCFQPQPKYDINRHIFFFFCTSLYDEYIAIILYELMNSNHIPFLRMLSVLLSIGGFLIFAESSAFSADIIFFNEQDKNGKDFVIENNIEIVIEWGLSFCIFIACFTLSLLIIRSTKNNILLMIKQKKLERIKKEQIQ